MKNLTRREFLILTGLTSAAGAMASPHPRSSDLQRVVFSLDGSSGRSAT